MMDSCNLHSHKSYFTLTTVPGLASLTISPEGSQSYIYLNTPPMSVQAEDTQTDNFLFFSDPISTTEPFYKLNSSKERKFNSSTRCVNAFFNFFEFLKLLTQNSSHHILVMPIESAGIYFLKKHLRHTVGLNELNNFICLVQSKVAPSWWD